jgi:hypothetical protein
LLAKLVFFRYGLFFSRQFQFQLTRLQTGQ